MHSHGLITTILGLHLVLDSSHFQNGSMRVKCLTSVSPVIPYAPIHSSSSDGSAAAEARESGLSSIINGNRKPNFVQRKPPLAESREAFLLGEYWVSYTKLFFFVFLRSFANFFLSDCLHRHRFHCFGVNYWLCGLFKLVTFYLNHFLISAKKQQRSRSPRR